MEFIGHLPELPDCFPPGCAELIERDGESIVWLLRCEDVGDVNPFLSILPEALRQRHLRFRIDADRHRFAARHLFLRCLLGSYLELKPDQVEIVAGPRGKPLLAEPASGLHFSLSRSGSWTLLALAAHAVGVDFEQEKMNRNWDLLGSGVFSQREIHDLSNLGERLDDGLFLRYWTAKEAILKAIGSGLHASMSEIDLQVEPHTCIIRDLPSGFPAPGLWTVRRMDIRESTVASLAITAQDERR